MDTPSELLTRAADLTWEFDVAVSTHDWLQRGVTVLDHRRVTVLSPDYLDASLCALQMADGPDDVVVTDILWRY